MNETFNPRVTPWQIDESDFYEIDSFEEQMRFLLRYAVLAPSTHNTQPWSFRITPEGVEVFADFSRRLLIVDPHDRELLMSVGAAIMNFRVAAAHFGFQTDVLYEIGEEEGRRVARMMVRETCATDPHLRALFAAIVKRHTNRELFESRLLEPEMVERLSDLLDEYPETLQVMLPRDTQRVAELVAFAERKQMSREAFRSEVADWIRPSSGYSDGICSDGLGVPAVFSPATSWLVRNVDVGGLQSRRDIQLTNSAAALLVVTAENERASLIRAGEILEQLLLTLTAMGLAYSFLNQPIEVEELRDRVEMLAATRKPAQLLLRIGFAASGSRPMPRRPLDNVVAGSR